MRRGEATLLQVCRGGYRATGLIATSISGPVLSESGRSYRWEWGKLRRNFVRRDFDERLGIAQLQCGRVPTDHAGRIGEALGGFEFAFSVNDLRATFALRFCLTRDGPSHLLRQGYTLDFHGPVC